MGKVVIEEKVLEEAGYLKEVIAGFDGKPFDLAELVTKVSLHTTNMHSSITVISMPVIGNKPTDDWRLNSLEFTLLILRHRRKCS